LVTHTPPGGFIISGSLASSFVADYLLGS